MWLWLRRMFSPDSIGVSASFSEPWWRPTDAIAATSIARRVGLPARIVDILEGESLINDATGLLALQIGTAILVQNHVPTIASGVATLAWLIAGGIGLGLLVGWIVDRIERRIDDGPIEITLSILVHTPFISQQSLFTLPESWPLSFADCFSPGGAPRSSRPRSAFRFGLFGSP